MMALPVIRPVMIGMKEVAVEMFVNSCCRVSHLPWHWTIYCANSLNPIASLESSCLKRQNVAVNMPVQDLSNIDLPGAARAS